MKKKRIKCTIGLVTVFVCFACLMYSQTTQAQYSSVNEGGKLLTTVDNSDKCEKHIVTSFNKFSDKIHDKFSNNSFSGHRKFQCQGLISNWNSGLWSGIGFGFTQFVNLDYNMYSPGSRDFMNLNWFKSRTLTVNPMSYSISLSKSKPIYFTSGIGLEYQRLVFDNDHITLTRDDEGKVMPLSIPQDFDVRRSTLKNLFLTIPFLLETHSNHIKVGVGLIGGFKLLTRTKVVYDYMNDKNRIKNTNSFGTIPLKLDATLRFSFFNWGIFGNYTFTPMFQSDKGPKLFPLTIGIFVTHM